MKRHKMTKEKMIDIMKRILLVSIIILLVSLVSLGIHSIGIKAESLPVVYLAGVIVCTFMARGYFYGILSAILSIIIYNYLFAIPRFSFVLLNTSDLMFYIIFLLSALISGYISAKLQKQIKISKKNEQTLKHIYEITEAFSLLTGVDSITEQAEKLIEEYCQCEADIYLESYAGDIQKQDDILIVDLISKTFDKKLGEIQINHSEELETSTLYMIRMIAQEMTIALERELVYIERENIRLDYEKEKMKSVLLRSVSHDIRTPLTGIMGASSLIYDQISNLSEAQIKKLASDIKDESKWLMQSVTNILDMTRVSQGDIVVNKEWEMVYDLIMQAVQRFPKLSEENRLTVDIPEEKILLVEVDGKMMVSVLYNLLDNAIKHGGKDCHVLLRESMQGSNCIIEVCDDGKGMSQEMLDHCFDEFVTPVRQGDENRGMGLGLSLCKAIVEANGGTIQAESKLNEGSRFTISLPCKEIEYE